MHRRSLREELGRSYASHDQVGNLDWQDFDDVDVEITADTSGMKWLVSVQCPDHPNESLPVRSFPDEASANAYARSESERIHNKLLNVTESSIMSYSLVETLIRQVVSQMLLEVNDWQCNKHSLGFIDDQGNWLDCKGMSHGEYLYRYYYNETEPVTIPSNWIKVSNANNIFFCGESFDNITPQQINGLIQMWGECNRYSRWISQQSETFYVTFGLIEPNEMREELLYMEEMTVPEFLELYGGRSAIDEFYGMLLGESVERLVEADSFQCNSHSLGFVDDQGNWLDTEGADHSDYLWANVYGMEDNRPGGYPMPDGWIKVSNASQIFFGGNSWDEVTPEQIYGLIEMWNACSKYSRWIKREPETFQVIFGLISNKRRMSNLEEMTIPQFLKRYAGNAAIDDFYGMLLDSM